MTDILGKSFMVVGAGKSGISAVKLLLEKGAGRVVLSDIKPCSKFPDEAFQLKKEGLILECDGNLADTALHADVVIVSPGVPLTGNWYETARRNNKLIIGEVEFAYGFMKKNGAKIAAVTGTNGKTTAAALLYEIMKAKFGDKAALGGNIGIPACDLVAGGAKPEIVVLEVSSFQLETIKDFRPDVAVILNITEDHLDRYASMQEYAQAKANIFRNQSETDVLALNNDDRFTGIMLTMSRSAKKIFSVNGPVAEGWYYDAGTFYKSERGRVTRLFGTDGVKLLGRHNYENILACMILAEALGVSPAEAEPVIKNFRGLPHRIEFSGEVRGRRFYDDSKGTNIDAVIKAVNSIDENTVLILGGREKGTDFTRLLPLLPPQVKHIIAFGENKDKVEEVLAVRVPVTKASDMDDVVKKSLEIKDIKAVLLSPGCASFDMFRDYKHRGNEFKKSVKKAAENEQGN